MTKGYWVYGLDWRQHTGTKEVQWEYEHYHFDPDTEKLVEYSDDQKREQRKG